MGFLSILLLFFFLLLWYVATSWFRYKKNIQTYHDFPSVIPQFWDVMEPLMMLKVIPPRFAPIRRETFWDQKYQYYQQQKSDLITIPSRSGSGGLVFIADPEIMHQ